MRIGSARTTGPNTASPHVYTEIIDRLSYGFMFDLRTTATALELSNAALLITVK